jgi:hypothetical protein
MKIKILSVTMLAILVAAVLVATPVSACELGLSPGFWKHNVNVYCGGHGSYSGDIFGSPQGGNGINGHITPGQLEWYAAVHLNPIVPSLPTHAEIVAFLNDCNSKFQDNAYKDMWLTIANWFNEAAGLAPYTD